MVFPGQGSQSVGMLDDLAQRYACIQQTFVEGSDAIGLDLWRLATTGPEEQLAMTAITQPIMLCAGVATWRAWCESSPPSPAFLAGHSLGEYAALVAAQALDLATATRLVHSRGTFMQEAVPVGEGAMAAIIGLDAARIAELCAGVEGEVSVANYNSPQQTVISGATAAVDQAVELARAAGAKRVTLLPVSAPFHCALMQPAADALRPLLDDAPIQAPRLPVVHNVDLSISTRADDVRAALFRQIASPVRWVESIRLMAEQGVTVFVESGPGKILTGLGKRICPEQSHHSIHDVDSLLGTVETLTAPGAPE